MGKKTSRKLKNLLFIHVLSTIHCLSRNYSQNKNNKHQLQIKQLTK